MIALDAAEVVALTGGTAHGVGDALRVTAPAQVDSRLCEPGGLFVAVAGERVDGHDFATAAHEAGAVLTLASRPLDVPCVVVDDVVAALSAVAAEVVRRLTSTLVVGVTGSQGKTSTKDLLAQALAAVGPVVAPRGNLNNEIGVPLTLTRASAGTASLVVEMGARGVGHVAALCRVARPRVGVVLNVGTAHLGEFGSVDAIARAKGELVESLPADGVAVLSADDPRVAAMASRTDARVLLVGRSPEAELRAVDVEVGPDATASFALVHGGRRADVRLAVIGEHQVANATAAAAVCLVAGMSLQAAAEALSAARPLSAWRMERHDRDDGLVVLNDAYNANPESVRGALRTLSVLTAGRPGARSVAVLGEMLELGADAERAHREVGSFLHELDVDRVVLVGPGARPVAAPLDAARVDLVDDVEQAATLVRGWARPDDVVLVKASRASGLERVASAVLEPTGHTRAGSAGGTDPREGAETPASPAARPPDERIPRR